MPTDRVSHARSGSLFGRSQPQHYVVARTDGGARGNPGPAGYGVVIESARGERLAAFKKYLGKQTNNYAEYAGLIAALEYALAQGHKAVRVVSDSELMVRQIGGQYKVSNSVLQQLHKRAKELIAQLDWFDIQHVMRGHNADADRLANEAMDEGARSRPAAAPQSGPPHEVQQLNGVVRKGVVELVGGSLPEGTRVKVRKA